MANTAAGTHIAIVSSHDIHPAITAGQFVYVKNSGLTEGLYTAKSNIAANAALSTSNLAAVPNGGLNVLKAGLDTLNSNLTNSQTVSQTVNGITCVYVVRSGFCYVRLNGTPTTANNIEFTVPTALIGAYLTCGQWGDTSNMMQLFIDSGTAILKIRNHNNNSINVTTMYPVA